MDRCNLDKIQKILPSSGSILFLRDYDFGGPVALTWLYDLYVFVEELKKPEYEFINNKLERKRKELISDITEFTHIFGANTFPIQNPGILVNEILGENPQKAKISQDLNKLATKIYEEYCELIRMGKRL